MAFQNDIDEEKADEEQEAHIENYYMRAAIIFIIAIMTLAGWAVVTWINSDTLYQHTIEGLNRAPR